MTEPTHPNDSETLWADQKIGVHDHKPQDECIKTCPAHPDYPAYAAQYKESGPYKIRMAVNRDRGGPAPTRVRGYA